MSEYMQTYDTEFQVSQKLFIGGEWVDSANSDKTFEVTNPANGEVIATLPDAGREDICDRL